MGTEEFHPGQRLGTFGDLAATPGRGQRLEHTLAYATPWWQTWIDGVDVCSARTRAIASRFTRECMAAFSEMRRVGQSTTANRTNLTSTAREAYGLVVHVRERAPASTGLIGPLPCMVVETALPASAPHRLGRAHMVLQ